jgi:hypothetical protein
VKLHLFKYRCKHCHSTFKAPTILSSAYGEFLLRSEGRRTEAYLNAITDPVYREVDALVKAHSKVARMRSSEAADVLQKIFGVACDPDSDGTEFRIDRLPRCSSCGGEPDYWEATESPEIVENELRPVTHERWNRMSAQEKGLVVDRAVTNRL